jgi:hypothetical protein
LNRPSHARDTREKDAREEKQKHEDDETIGALAELVRKCGLNGSAESEAARIIRRCAFAGGPRRVTQRLDYALATNEQNPIDYAIQKTTYGEICPTQGQSTPQ